jgi:hypothetical protein
MSSFNHIQFRFIRRADFGNNSGAKDDVVTLKQVENNLYSLNYVHRYQGDTHRTYVVVKEEDAITWLYSMLSLLGVDKDPFYRIQLDLPHFPSILLDSYNLGAKLHEIVEAVRFSMRNYPLPVRTIVHTQVDESHGLEDEGEEEEEDAEEDYDDMPGLVPVTPYNFTSAYEGRRHLFLDHEEATSAVAQGDGTPA